MAVEFNAARDALQLVTLLERKRFPVRDEREFQDGVESVLVDAGRTYRREPEFRHGAVDRLDFAVTDSAGSFIALELKVKGSPGSILRQLRRYAELSEVSALVLFTTRASHTRGLPRELNGKPLLCALQMGAF
jgi:hypothetical protein